MTHETAQEASVRETGGRFFRLLGECVADVFAEEIDWFVPGDQSMLPRAGRRTRHEQVPLQDSVAGVRPGKERDEHRQDPRRRRRRGLARFSPVVKANGRHLSMLVAFHFTVESGYLVRLHLYEDTDLVARAVTASD
jgi:ketosteroid isomerase-like protein